MANDEMKALRDFRAELLPPDAEAQRRIYAHATGDSPLSTGQRLQLWSQSTLPRVKPRIVVALSGAVICAAAATLVASGAFSGGTGPSVLHAGGPTHTRPHAPSGLEAPPDPLSVSYNRSGGTLTSIEVTASPTTANASTEIEVLAATASATPGMATGPVTVVYKEQVPLTAAPVASAGQRPSWSGTFSPTDWGCRADWLYRMLLVAVGPGTSLADAVSGTPAEQVARGDAEFAGTGWFSCGNSGGS